jgi:hypothetical protein
MAHHINYKMPRARKESSFTVYPFSQGERMLRLQSENHCIIVDTEKNKMLVSKRFAQYPRFEYCDPKYGGKVMDIPAEIQSQVDEIVKAPTGKEVSLVG